MFVVDVGWVMYKYICSCGGGGFVLAFFMFFSLCFRVQSMSEIWGLGSVDDRHSPGSSMLGWGFDKDNPKRITGKHRDTFQCYIPHESLL